MRRLLSILLMLCILSGKCYASALLKEGSSGNEVLKLQKRLVELGFLNTLPDGKYGKETMESVRSFQKSSSHMGHKLSQDGIAGEQTLSAIYDDNISGEFLYFNRGERGLRVVWLQERLYDLAFLFERPDGIFGTNTENALKDFQKHAADNGADITINGCYDKATREILLGDMKALNIEAPEFFVGKPADSLNEKYLYARSCALIDARTGEVLFAKNADEKMYPASTTKIMTLLVCLEKGNIDKQVKVPKEAGEVPKDSSLVPVYPGENMSIKDLLYGLMLRSGNDAANALAVLLSGSIPEFVNEMNIKARHMGLKNTHFVNPHGYHDEEHISSAMDMCNLTRQAIQSAEFCKIAMSSEYIMPPTNKRAELNICSSAEILNPESKYYYPLARGIKSGYTKAAGHCYVGAAIKGDRVLIATVMDCRQRYMLWQDMKNLFEYGFSK